MPYCRSAIQYNSEEAAPPPSPSLESLVIAVADRMLQKDAGRSNQGCSQPTGVVVGHNNTYFFWTDTRPTLTNTGLQQTWSPKLRISRLPRFFKFRHRLGATRFQAIHAMQNFRGFRRPPREEQEPDVLVGIDIGTSCKSPNQTVPDLPSLESLAEDISTRKSRRYPTQYTATGNTKRSDAYRTGKALDAPKMIHIASTPFWHTMRRRVFSKDTLCTAEG